jgi:hypothetical protein
VTPCDLFLRSVLQLPDTANAVPSKLILSTLMLEAVRSSESSVSTRALGITSQKTAFVIINI